MNQLYKFLAKTSIKPYNKTLTYTATQQYHFPAAGAGNVHHNPGLTAKRIVKCIGERLRKVDPGRWETVPITFKTHFRDENGHTDIATSIHIHDAIEREFGIDIKDRQILITDVETAFYVILQHHDSH